MSKNLDKHGFWFGGFVFWGYQYHILMCFTLPLQWCWILKKLSLFYKGIASFKEQQNDIPFQQPQHLSKTKWAFGPYQTSLCSDSVYLNLEQWFLNGKKIYIVTIKGQKPVKIPNLNFQDQVKEMLFLK